MAYPLESMLKIRTMREDRAATDLTRARRARQAAETELRKKTDSREQYELTKESRRDRIYDAVMGRAVTVDLLDEARDAVRQIDEEGVLLEEAERKAAAELDEKKKLAAAAHVRYVAAEKNKQKVELHREVWMEDDRREQERLADAEMEEFSGKRTEDDDDA